MRLFRLFVTDQVPRPGQQRVHGRHDEQGQQRAERHAADDHPADLLTAFGSGPLRQRQRHRSQHHGPGRYQDRAQAENGGFDDGIELGPTLVLKLVGELDDQDAVFGDQSHQGHEADLAVDVERAAREIQGQQRTDHGQRDRQHDHQRVQKAFELRRQHEIDEAQCQHEDEDQAGAGLAEIAALACIVDLHFRRQHLVRRLLHEGDGLAQQYAGDRGGADGGGAELVEAVEFLGRHHLPDLDEVGELDHRAVATPDIDLAEVAWGRTVGFAELDVDVVLLAVALEPRYLPAAKQAFQRARDDIDLDAGVRHLVAVDHHVELRLVQLQVAVDVDQSWILRDPLLHAIDIAFQVLVGAGCLDD